MASKIDVLLNKYKKSPALHVTLRKAEKRDVPTLAQWMQNDDFQFLLSVPRMPTLKETKDLLLEQISLNVMTFSSRQTLLVESSSGAALGFITLARIDWRNKHCALESYFDSKYRETPYPISAGVKVFSYVFQELQMRKVYSFVQGFNENSMHIHQRYGNKPEAVLKEYLLKDGKYYDMYIFATYRDSSYYKDLPKELRAETVYAFLPPLESIQQLTKVLVVLGYLPETKANRQNLPSGKELTEAITKYQNDKGLKNTGEVTGEMIGSLFDDVYSLLRTNQV